MLASSELVAFVATSDLHRAAEFYGETLGLETEQESPIALLFNANGTVIRVTLVDQLSPAPYTVLGWAVRDIEQTIRSLQSKGVRFERFHGMEHDDLGVWTAPGGDRVAWFKDPDGNVLSLTQPG